MPAACLQNEQLSDNEVVCVLPGGALVMNVPPFDRLFAKSVGQGLYALALSRWEIPSSGAAFFLRDMARQAFTRLAHAAVEQPDDVGGVLAHLHLSSRECVSLAEKMPPVKGGEYVTPRVIAGWLESLSLLVEEEMRGGNLLPSEWLRRLGSPWNQIGKVFFHLAENRDDASGLRPFAFLATFAHQSAADDQIRHLSLGAALRVYEDNSSALLAVLQPLKQAAAVSPLMQSLLNSGKIYGPLAWRPAEAKDFLREIPLYEQAGIMVRMVNLWKTPPRRLQVKVAVTAQPSEASSPSQPFVHASGVSVRSLLGFSVSASLGGQSLSQKELEELLSHGDGLIRFKGEWVQVDADKIKDLLIRWNKAAQMTHRWGIPLVQGLRLLVNAPAHQLAGIPEPDEDCIIEPDEKLEEALKRLVGAPSGRLPEMPVDMPPELARLLRPYQRDGAAFLYRSTEMGFGVCLADDMGLGKTLQTLTWLEILRRQGRLDAAPALLVVPASLLGNWQGEAVKFTPALAVRVMHPSAYRPWFPAAFGCSERAHIVLTTYGMVARTAELQELEFSALILDEAQAIKNADSARTRAVHKLKAVRRVALSGTPVENKLEELWSLMDFLNPGLLGSKKYFEAFTRGLGQDYSPLRRMVRPFILRRMKTDPALVPDLPDKTEVPAYCLLSPEQAALYKTQIETLHAVLEESDPAARLMLILPVLAQLKQICNHPAQFQGTDDYAPERSGKFLRLRELCEAIAARQEKLILFTQFRTIIPHLRDLLSPIFKSPGLILHGGVPVPERQRVAAAFQQESGPPFCILSLKAAGTGLTLTQASHVIHVDRWWNPAVENQATDRAYRIGQHKNVLVHRMICRGTIEERIDSMLADKRRMTDKLFAGGAEQCLSRMSLDELKELFFSPSGGDNG